MLELKFKSYFRIKNNMSILKKLFGIKEESPSQETVVDSSVELKIELTSPPEVGVPADGDQVVRGE